LNKTGQRALDRYTQWGQKLVQADDRNTANGGLWIPVSFTYTESEDKSEVAISSYAYRMQEDFPVPTFAGDHYCKVLSPFKAMEWIYVDSLYDKLHQIRPHEDQFLQY